MTGVSSSSQVVPGRVSVIIPTYNRAAILPRALNSVRNQTYKDVEVVVVDDASTDNTAATVDPFRSGLNIIYIRNPRNLLAARSRNIGLKHATGEYISFLDDDDEFFPEKTARQVKLAQSLGEKVFIVCSGDRSTGPAYDPKKPSGFIHWGKGFFPLRLGLPPPSGWFFHREVFEKVGFFDEAMERWEDIDYILRLLTAFPVYMMNEFLVMWYFSADSLTRMSPLEVASREYFLKKHFELMRQDPDYLYKFYWRLGKDLKKLGEKSRAAGYFHRAFMVRPWRLEALGQCVALGGGLLK